MAWPHQISSDNKFWNSIESNRQQIRMEILQWSQPSYWNFTNKLNQTDHCLFNLVVDGKQSRATENTQHSCNIHCISHAISHEKHSIYHYSVAKSMGSDVPCVKLELSWHTGADFTRRPSWFHQCVIELSAIIKCGSAQCKSIALTNELLLILQVNTKIT